VVDLSGRDKPNLKGFKNLSGLHHPPKQANSNPRNFIKLALHKTKKTPK
jgi:hypothetical protein